MITMSQSDVEAFCIGAAQIVPVFLIALFVADSSVRARRAEELAKEISELERERGRLLSQARDIEHDLEGNVEKLDEEMAALDIIDPSQAGDEVRAALDETRETLMNARYQASSALAGLADTLNVRESASDSSERSKRRGASINRIKKSAVYLIVYGILVGVAGEIVALGGAVGLIGGRFAIGWEVFIVLILISILTQFANERLMSDLPHVRFLGNFVFFFALIIGLAGFAASIWIMLNVRVAA